MKSVLTRWHGSKYNYCPIARLEGSSSKWQCTLLWQELTWMQEERAVPCRVPWRRVCHFRVFFFGDYLLFDHHLKAVILKNNLHLSSLKGFQSDLWSFGISENYVTHHSKMEPPPQKKESNKQNIENTFERIVYVLTKLELFWMCIMFCFSHVKPIAFQKKEHHINSKIICISYAASRPGWLADVDGTMDSPLPENPEEDCWASSSLPQPYLKVLRVAWPVIRSDHWPNYWS